MGKLYNLVQAERRHSSSKRITLEIYKYFNDMWRTIAMSIPGHPIYSKRKKMNADVDLLKQTLQESAIDLKHLNYDDILDFRMFIPGSAVIVNKYASIMSLIYEIINLLDYIPYGEMDFVLSVKNNNMTGFRKWHSLL